MGIGKPITKWAMQETSGATVADSMSYLSATATSGNGRRFNGTSDYVQFANQITPQGAKTLKFKFRKSAVPADIQYVLINGNDSTTQYTFEVQVRIDGRLFFGESKIGSYRYQIYTPTSVCDNKWHELMLTWDGTVNVDGVKLYVDDMSTPAVTTTASSATVGAYGTNLCMGRLAGNATRYFAGDLDDVQMLNGSGTVVAWWKMDDTAATAMVDSSTNAWAPTITGTTVISDTGPIIVSDGAGGYCRRFNGRSDRITASSSLIPFGTKTIKFKMRKSELDASTVYGRILSTGSSIPGSTDNALEIYTRPTDDANKPGGITMTIRNAGTLFVGLHSTISVCDGQWHDIMYKFDPTTKTVSLYIDDMATPNNTVSFEAGVLEASGYTQNLMIGATSATTPSNFFRGDLKNLEVYVGTGTERTKVEDMQIGDFIIANYTAASGAFGWVGGLGTASPSSWISAAASSATPNGSFYFVYVGDDYLGRKKLVADRNVQQTITWSDLHGAGLSSMAGLPRPIGLGTNLDPASPTGGSYLSNTNTVWSVGANISNTKGVRALQGKSAGKWYWEVVRTAGGGNTANIGICQKDYTFAANTSTAQRSYGYNGNKYPENVGYGLGWTAGTEVIGVVMDVDSGTLEFYRNGVSQGISHTNLGSMTKPLYAHGYFDSAAAQSMTFNFGDLPFAYPIPAGCKPYNYSPINDTAKFYFRMPSGGLAATDTNNEWDQYIVRSTLNGTITPANNAFWNWQNQYSWTLSTTGSSTSREIRGYSAANFRYGGIANTYSSATTGFRPVLVVDPSRGKDKILIQDGADIKSWREGSWTTVGQAPVTEAMFDNNQGCDMDTLNSAAIQQLTSSTPTLHMKRVTYAIEPPELLMRAEPNPKVVLASGDIYLNSYATVTAAAVTQSIVGAGVAGLIFSYDQGKTWYKPPTTTSVQTTAQVSGSTAVTASSEDTAAGYNAWKAFDQTYAASSTSGWQSADNGLPAWIAYDFGAPTILTSYSLGMRFVAASGCFPKAWELQGYDSAQQRWVTINTQTKSTNDWVNGTKQTFTPIVAAKYSKYRIYITQTFGAGYVDIGEIDLIGPGALQVVDTTNVADVKAKALALSSIGSVPTNIWMLGRDLGGTSSTPSPDTLRFGYYLEQTNLFTDLAAIDLLTLTVTMAGSWDMAIEGTEYSYSYPARDTLRIKVLANGDYKVNY